MKKWLRFFSLSFFSDRISKEGARRGYTNVFLALLLSFVILWSGFVGVDMLPFSARYKSSPDFAATVRLVLANPDVNKRIGVEVKGGRLIFSDQAGNHTEAMLINTYESNSDKEAYSVGGYNIIVDSRPADALAEVEAYCLSNDGNNTKISYEDYLTLSEVARLNFDFKLRYTGKELKLGDELVEKHRTYLLNLDEENKSAAEKLDSDLADGKISENEYNRKIYELYFIAYYPEIGEYESSSKLPLLRNYYYHQYLKDGRGKYLFIFDDYMAGSFETKGGSTISFYGFYSNLDDGSLIPDGTEQKAAERNADSFINQSYSAMFPITLYAHAMNVFSLIPFIALMPMVVTMLAYSILKLKGIDSLSSLGATFKIVGSYSWFSAVVSVLLTVIGSFFLSPNILAVLPLLLFFITLAVRAIIFAVNEAKSYINQSKQQETVHTEA